MIQFLLDRRASIYETNDEEMRALDIAKLRERRDTPCRLLRGPLNTHFNPGLMTCAHNLSDGCRIVKNPQEAIGHIGARDRESESGQVSIANSILPGMLTISKSWGSYQGPVQLAFPKGVFHRAGIDHNAGK